MSIRRRASAIFLVVALAAASCTDGDDSVATTEPPPAPPINDEFVQPPDLDEAPEGQSPAESGVEYEFETLSSGAGGFVTGLDSNLDGSVLLARTDVGGAYRWDPAAASWQQLLSYEGVDGAEAEDYQVEAMAIAPSDPDRLYLSTGGDVGAQQGRILRSDDGGSTWRASSQRFGVDGNGDWRTSGERLAVHPLDPDVVLLGTRADGLWRSTDGGTTFSSVPSVPLGTPPENENETRPGVLFVVFSADAATAWAGVAGEGVFASTDGGVNWSLAVATAGLPFDAEESVDGRLWVAVRDPGQVLVLDGATVTDVTPDENKDYETITVDPFDPQRAIVGGRAIGQGDLWRTTDGGNTWDGLDIRTSCTSIPWLEIYPNDFLPTGSLRFDRAVQDQIWVPEGFGIWRGLHSGGGTLELECEAEGVEELVSNDVVVPPGGRPVTAHWDRGIFWHGTTDAVDAINHPARRFNTAWDLDWTPADPEFVVAVIGDQRTCCRNDEDSFHSGYSTDGGRTWTPFGSYEAGHPEKLLFGNIAVSADDTSNLAWLPSFNSALHISRDQGDTWEEVLMPGTEDMFNQNGNFNGGSHRQYFLNRKVLVADRVAPATFYLYHQELGLFTSNDGGSTWSLQPSDGLPVGWTVGFFNAQLVASPTTEGHLIFSPGLQNDAEWPTYESRDGGVSWQVIPGTSEVTAIGFGASEGDEAAIYLAGRMNGERGVWRSDDGAATWSLVSLAPGGNYQGIKAITGDLTEPGTIYVGFTGTSFMVGRSTPIGES